MKGRRIVPLLFALAWGAAGTAQEKSSTKTEAEGYRVPEQLIESLEGRDLFRAYCAACHGENARGGGPAASSLKGKVPDLTRIAERRGGTFPLPQVERIIAGEETVATAHGSREMPIWGPIFGQVQRDQNLGKIRVRNLAKYLESIQGK
jgi:mono/diheme cytochrome c family protein